MEEQLAEYRARKAKEKRDSESKSWTSILFENRYLRKRGNEEERNMQTSEEAHITELVNDRRVVPNSSENQPNIPLDHYPVNEDVFPLTRREKVIYAVKLGLKIALWLIIWALFIEIGFGAVFFVVSTLFFIYRTMRTDSRDRSKLSAYSVFNPNFERLDGTFTAEQFERELRYGAGSVR